ADGTDTLIGGTQGDILFAGTGMQTLTGGTGADKFVLKPNSTVTITDFEVGIDKLVVQAADQTANQAHAGKDAHADVQVHSHDGNTIIDTAGVHIELVGVKPAQITDIDHLFA